MTDTLIQIVLIVLLVFTPVAFGAVELWAYTLMELGILLMVLVAAVEGLRSSTFERGNAFLSASSVRWRTFFRSSFGLSSSFGLPLLLFAAFLLLLLFQLSPLPPGMVASLSPKTLEIRQWVLSIPGFPESSTNRSTLSLVPLATKVELYKWVTLGGFFFLLLSRRWDGSRVRVCYGVILMVGLFESLYGIGEFFSGHRHVLTLEAQSWLSSVSGTFVNRNNFAGYLLMTIPTSMGLLYSRALFGSLRKGNLRHTLASLDGKTVVIGFSIVVMILALILSASRMGIASLLLSVGLVSLLFRNPRRRSWISWRSLLVFFLALVWAAGLGLDPVISRFFQTGEDLKLRWQFWEDTFRILKDYPLFGTGLGTFSQVFCMYRSMPLMGFASHAENDFLQLTSEVGLIGMAILSALFFVFLRRGISAIQAIPSGRPERYMALGSLVGILALMLHSVVEKNIAVPANSFLFTFLFAMFLRPAFK